MQLESRTTRLWILIHPDLSDVLMSSMFERVLWFNSPGYMNWWRHHGWELPKIYKLRRSYFSNFWPSQRQVRSKCSNNNKKIRMDELDLPIWMTFRALSSSHLICIPSTLEVKRTCIIQASNHLYRIGCTSWCHYANTSSLVMELLCPYDQVRTTKLNSITKKFPLYVLI